MIDPQILSALVIVFITLTRAFGLDLDAGKATEIVSALAVLISAAVVYYQRLTLQKAPHEVGDVTFAGFKR